MKSSKTINCKHTTIQLLRNRKRRPGSVEEKAKIRDFTPESEVERDINLKFQPEEHGRNISSSPWNISNFQPDGKRYCRVKTEQNFKRSRSKNYFAAE